MRRRLIKALPGLCQFYGIKPWEIERMTLREIAEFQTQLREAEQAETPA